MNPKENLPESREMDSRELTVLHSRSVADLPRIQADLLGTDHRVADLFLRFVRETAGARDNRILLRSLICEFTFAAFPQATHLGLVIRDPSGAMKPFIAQSREGDIPTVSLSSTLMDRVMSEKISIVFSHSDVTQSSESIISSGIQTAMCAPLSGLEEPIGIIQLDIRGSGSGTFTKKDVDRITVFSNHVALVLENHRLHLDQRRAFESTISALVHSLSLKDPATAYHSMRVRDVSVLLGLKLDLNDTQLESLRMAALLHDMGKQGVRDEVLLKPGRLTDDERREMSQHSELTQGILDKIAYPTHLRDVPSLAAYHHEKMDGSGPFRLSGDVIPIQSRIISVADVFDALVSARVYKKPMPPEQALAILDQGKNLEFDPLIVDTLRESLVEVMSAVYPEDDQTTRLAA